MKRFITNTLLILATSSLAFSQTLEKVIFNAPTNVNAATASATATGRIVSQNVNLTLTTTNNGTGTTFGTPSFQRVPSTNPNPYNIINTNPAQFPNIGPISAADNALLVANLNLFDNSANTFTLTITFDQPAKDLYFYIGDFDSGILQFQGALPSLVSNQNTDLSYNPITGILQDSNPATTSEVTRDVFGTFYFNEPVSQISWTIRDNPNLIAPNEIFRFGFAVPEPSSAILALLGSSLALLRRRR